MATKMTRAERERFFTTLAHATDERAVQAAYETGLLIFLPKGTTFDYPCKCDGYLDVDMFLRLLLEYKLNERLEEAPQRAKVLVQIIFYLKRFEEAGIELPSVLFVGDRDECFLLHSNQVLDYLDYDADWTLPPSDAWRKHPSLVADLAAKLPPALVADLEADKPFLFFINPPYSSANSMKWGEGTKKKDCAMTAVNAEMNAERVGPCAQNLLAQFIYRIIQIKRKFNLPHCALALFCNPIYLSGSQYRGLRELLLQHFHYDRGILFNAGYFSDVSEDWGIDFTVWSPGPSEACRDFPHTLIELSEGRLIPVGRKNIYNMDGETTGSDWCKEPLGKVKAVDAPQLSSALKWKQKGRGKLVPGALGYYYNVSNNVYQNAKCVFLLSSTSTAANGISVLPANFLRVTANFTARKLIAQDWTNAKDEYCVPDVSHPDYPGFEADSVVFALFHPSSQQSSLGHVDYKGREWDIPNQWFWLTRAEAEEAVDAAGLTETWQRLRTDTERYVAERLPEWEPRMSPEAREVLRLARRVAKASYAHRAEMDTLRPDLQLLRWDAGWHQLKPLAQAWLPADFAAFQAAFRALAARLRPLVHALSFLR